MTRLAKLALMVIVGALLFAAPVGAQTGLKVYVFTVEDEFGYTVTDDCNMVVFIAGSSAATVYSDKNGTAIGTTLETVTDGIYKFWYGPGTCDIVVKNNATGRAVKYVTLTPTDHRIMLSGVGAQLGSTTYTGSVIGVAATWSGTVTMNGATVGAAGTWSGTATFNGDTVIGNAVTDNLTIAAALVGAGPLILDGATDDTSEMTIAVEDPTADHTMTVSDDTGSFAYTPTGKTTLSGAGVIVTTHAIVEVTTTGSDALSLANGNPGQILTVVIVSDGGEGTLTPATSTGWATAVLTTDIDSITMMYIDDTVGWIILGTATDGTEIVAITQ